MEYKVSKNTKEAVLYQCYDRWSTAQVVVRALFFSAVIIGPVWIMSKSSYEWRHSPWTPWLFWLGVLGPWKVFWRKSKAKAYVEDFNNRVKTLLADANAAYETKFEYEKIVGLPTFDTFAVFDTSSRKVLFASVWTNQTEVFDFSCLLKWKTDYEEKTSGYSEDVIVKKGPGTYAMGTSGYSWTRVIRAYITYTVKDMNNPYRIIVFKSLEEANLWSERTNLMVNEGCST